MMMTFHPVKIYQSVIKLSKRNCSSFDDLWTERWLIILIVKQRYENPQNLTVYDLNDVSLFLNVNSDS